MAHFNDLIMAILCGFLLLVGNNYLPMPGLINLIFNFLMIIITVLYIMQFLNVIRPILPTFEIFK